PAAAAVYSKCSLASSISAVPSSPVLYPLSLHDALPIFGRPRAGRAAHRSHPAGFAVVTIRHERGTTFVTCDDEARPAFALGQRTRIEQRLDGTARYTEYGIYTPPLQMIHDQGSAGRKRGCS